jgi:hypothetical protein
VVGGRINEKWESVRKMGMCPQVSTRRRLSVVSDTPKPVPMGEGGWRGSANLGGFTLLGWLLRALLEMF